MVSIIGLLILLGIVTSPNQVTEDMARQYGCEIIILEDTSM